MRYWWVNQNQTYKAEISGGYLWSPKRNRNGARNQFYENMREVSPGDLIFSFCDTRILAVGVAQSYCYPAPQPVEFDRVGHNWDQSGWRVNVSYYEILSPIIPKQHIELIRPSLPKKYSPLQQDGNGLQSVYLAEIGVEFATLLQNLLRSAGNDVEAGIPAAATLTPKCLPDEIRQNLDDQVAKEIVESTTVEETEKVQLVLARKGQGRFRQRVQKIEPCCRITGVSDSGFLIASHIKPWRSSTNEERLDGENGFMLTPTIDFLFDRGFISFGDDGSLLISPVADKDVLKRLGVPIAHPRSCGSFTRNQKHYLAYHRSQVYLQAGVES
jgi:putative restriction endonuclease